MEFFYDKQIRKYMLQFARIFSNVSVEKGRDAAGNPIYIRIPIMYGDSSRQAATILANNSANNLPSTPLLTYYVTGFEYDRARIQNPTHIDSRNVRQREYDQTSGTFTERQGDAFTIDRLMPVPYILRMNVDLWTTSTDQKLQFIEQVGVLFNPALDIQSNDNIFDWGSLTTVFQEGPNFSSRSIPQGTGNPIDVMTWKFSMPIWITAPAKLKKMGFIQKIITNIFHGSQLTDMTDADLLMGTRQKITPYGYKLLLIGNQLQLIPASQPFHPDGLDLPPSPDTTLLWTAFLEAYGVMRPGVSQIRLENPHMSTEIVGTIQLNPDDDRVLTYTIDPDTLPQDTLAPVDRVIDPHQYAPDAVATNLRYLILADIRPGSVVWGNLTANANDIIQYNGTEWVVSFDSNASTDVQYVTNLRNSVQYRYSDSEWNRSIEGWYDSGSFSIVI